MKQRELKEIYDKAFELAIAICGWKVINQSASIYIEDDGHIIVELSRDGHCGETDYEWIELTEEEMNTPIAETVAKRNKIKEIEYQKRQEEMAEQQRKQKEENDKLDYATYIRLKKKFENQ